MFSLQLVSQPRAAKIAFDASFKLKQTYCTAYQPYWNAPKDTAADSLFLIMEHCMCRLHWSLICRWVVKTLRIPQCPLHVVRWTERSPSASFTVINGDGDNCSFIGRSCAVCVDNGRLHRVSVLFTHWRSILALMISQMRVSLGLDCEEWALLHAAAAPT